MVREITEGLFWVEGARGATFPHCHTYLLSLPEVVVAFDPSCGRPELRRALKQMGRALSDVTIVVNTHFHADHILGNGFLKKKAGTRVFVHEADFPALSSLNSYISRYGLEYDQILLDRWRGYLEVLRFDDNLASESFSSDATLPGNFQVVHTPGHSPGHCSFFHAETGTLIAGDMDLTVPWVANVTSNVGDFLASIEKLKRLPIKALLPGHGKPVFDGITDKLAQYADRLIRREEKLLAILPEHPISLDDVMKRVFEAREDWESEPSGDHGAFQNHFRRMTTQNYLIHLKEVGKVVSSKRDGSILWSIQ